MASSDLWDEETALAYDADSVHMFLPEVLDPAIDLLASLAGPGPALEFAVGTGRLAIPLAQRGIEVWGIDLSPAMVDRLRAKDPGHQVQAVVADMATTCLPGKFSLVYLAWNSISNLRTQAEQVACFRNAARHLLPGGCFVIELFVPALRRLPPGQVAVPFDIGADHVGFDTYDLVNQECTSHHFTRRADGSYRRAIGHFRYIWPSECDLMAALAGLELQARYADWRRSPFTENSQSHVSIWTKPVDEE